MEKRGCMSNEHLEGTCFVRAFFHQRVSALENRAEVTSHDPNGLQNEPRADRTTSPRFGVRPPHKLGVVALESVSARLVHFGPNRYVTLFGSFEGRRITLSYLFWGQ